MPFPRNWLEEFVVEWLDLAGFLAQIGVPVAIPEGKGGHYEADVVGGKIGQQGALEIRHCEVSTGLGDNPDKTAAAYKKKFSRTVESKVTSRFRELFGVGMGAREPRYERWIIVGSASNPVISALHRELSPVKICKLEEFIPKVVEDIQLWREKNPVPRHTPAFLYPSLPQDKWLLWLLDFATGSGALRSALKTTGGARRRLSRS